MFGGMFSRIKSAPKAPPPATTRAEIRRMVEASPNVMRLEMFALRLVAAIREQQGGDGWYYLPDQIDGLADELAEDLNVAPYRHELVRDAILAVPGVWSAKKRTCSDPGMAGVRAALKARGRDPGRATVYYIPGDRLSDQRPRPDADPALDLAPAPASQATGRSTGGPRPAKAQRPKKARTFADVRRAA